MAGAYTMVQNFSGAGNGASGTSEILGSTRARIFSPETQTRTQMQGDDLMPRKIINLCSTRVRVSIETESFVEYIQALALLDANTEEVVILNYWDSAQAARKVTCKFGRLVAVNESTFPPREDGGRGPKYELTYELYMGSGVTKLSEAVADSSGHATLS